MDKMKVLVTGAAGLVGGHLREFWGDRYQLRLSDIKPMDNLATHEEYVEMDITNYDAFLAACQGMDALVHLAADPSMDAEFYETLLPLNIIGCYNGFEAARQAGCKRIVFASSINAILGYGEGEDPKPQTLEDDMRFIEKVRDLPDRPDLDEDYCCRYLHAVWEKKEDKRVVKITQMELPEEHILADMRDVDPVYNS